MILSFTIPGRPVTWRRTNHVNGRRLTDKSQRQEKRRVAALARAALPRGWPTDAAYAVEVIGYWPDRRVGDADRLVSLALDAMESVVYRVDRQVRAQSSAVLIDREDPRVEVTVAAYDEGQIRPVITIGWESVDTGDSVSRVSHTRAADVAMVGRR